MAIKVLVIDDDEDVARLIQVQLEREGHEVDIAPGGQQGLEAMRGQRPDLVVLDLRMSPVDGFEVMRAMAADGELANVPILVVSVVDAREEAAAGGAKGFVLKPFQTGGVASAVRELLSS